MPASKAEVLLINKLFYATSRLANELMTNSSEVEP
jgi:hypothetical protein